MFSFLKPRLSLRSLLPAGIDAHCHLLPGVDDGSECLEDSLNIIRAQQALGLRGAIATPHIMARYPDNTPTNLRSVFDSLLDFVNRKSEIVNFRLFLAAEYMLDDAFLRHLEHPDRLLTIPANLLGGTAAESQGNTEAKCAPCVNPASASSPNSTIPKSKIQNPKLAAADQNYILVELPQYLLPDGWQDMLDAISSAGFTPLLAHPERYLRILEENDLRALTERGITLQGNIGSLSGLYGSRVQTLAKKLHSEGLYAAWGSDAHNPSMLKQLKLSN